MELTDAVLRRILTREDGTGVLQQLNDPAGALRITDRLHALYELLVPTELRPVLTGAANKKIERVVVVPNGALALVPFEILVTDNEKPPFYLLDQAPPFIYAPSAAAFHYLVEKPSANSGQMSVLTLGDADYGAGDNSDAASGGANRSRFLKSRGSLERLQFTATESNWVARVFSDGGASVSQLRGADATEAKTREALAGKEIVHLACHGLVEPSFGNLFGALALAPSSRASLDPADDGFLTLAEMFELRPQELRIGHLKCLRNEFGSSAKR